MGDNRGKQVGARIKDPKVWDRFIEMVENKHGKVFGFAGVELEKALIFYLDHPDSTDISKKEKSYEMHLQDLQDEINELKHEIEIKSSEINQKNTNLISINDELSKIRNDHDKLRNSKDHLQERFNSSLVEINQLQNDLTNYKVALESLNGVGVIGRIRKKWGKNIQLLLTAGKEE